MHPRAATCALIGLLLAAAGCGAALSSTDEGSDAAATGRGGASTGPSGSTGLGGTAGMDRGGPEADSGGGSTGGFADAGNARDASSCNSMVDSARLASCSPYAIEPAATGGIIPDGSYELEQWQSAARCLLGVHEIMSLMRTGPSTYLAQGVGDLGNGAQGRTTVELSATDNMLVEHPLCGTISANSWHYSVTLPDGTPQLVLSDSDSLFVYLRMAVGAP